MDIDKMTEEDPLCVCGDTLSHHTSETGPCCFEDLDGGACSCVQFQKEASP